MASARTRLVACLRLVKLNLPRHTYLQDVITPATVYMHLLRHLLSSNPRFSNLVSIIQYHLQRSPDLQAQPILTHNSSLIALVRQDIDYDIDYTNQNFYANQDNDNKFEILLLRVTQLIF